MNSLFQQLNQGQKTLFPNKLKNMLNMIKSGGNPQAMVESMVANNPQIQQAIQQAGGDPKKAFYNMAQQMGVDPQEVLKMMK